MAKRKRIKLFLIVLLTIVFSFCSLQSLYCASPKKIGVLILHAGANEVYTPEGIQIFNFMIDIFDPGFFAGGPIEGTTCYTLVHYANEAEAAICDVEEGTPIDVFCNKYNGSYPIHSLISHWPPSFGGDDGFQQNCFSPADPAVFPLTFGHTTVNPATGEKIFGPHVDDPDGSGIGIADFIETAAFTDMDLYARIPDHTLPYRKQVLKWWYGNDAPGYPPDNPEPINIKDRLQEMLPQYQFAFRHAWDTYAENVDIYGNAKQWTDSYETAIYELINDEKVDAIVVYYASLMFINLTQYGQEWYDDNDQGISAIPGKTYKECVENLNDGIGPATKEELNTFLTSKPWNKHWQHPLPLVKQLTETKQPTVDLRFAPPFGKFEDYEEAVLDLLNYTVSKYNIPQNTSLKVIFGHHGLYGAYMNAASCDCYNRVMVDEFANRVIARIKNKFSWTGKFEIISAPFKFAEGSTYDPPSPEKPFGKVMSVGEQIDTAINGTYVNGLGETIDNGTSNFDTIIVLQGNYYTDDKDLLYASREESIGNNKFGQSSYARDKADADGTPYTVDDIDADLFTIKVYDGTGWSSQPGCLQDSSACKNAPPVYKGNAQRPTKLIMCGTILGNTNSIGRDKLTEAGAKAIIEAINQPDIVDLKLFRAVPRNRSVKLTWITGSETGNKGFNIYRADSERGSFGKVNNTLISAQGGSGTTARYQYVDKDLTNGKKYFYLIEAMKNPVRTRKYGPASATPRLFWGVLP